MSSRAYSRSYRTYRKRQGRLARKNVRYGGRLQWAAIGRMVPKDKYFDIDQNDQVNSGKKLPNATQSGTYNTLGFGSWVAMMTMNDIPLGSTHSTRDSNSVWVTSLQCKGNIRTKPELLDHGDTATCDQYYRFQIVVDRQCNGASASAVQLLEGTTASDPLWQFKDLEHAPRFWILVDKTLKHPCHCCYSGDAAASGTEIYKMNNETEFNFYHKFKKPLKINFETTITNDGDGTTISNITTNNLFIVIYSRPEVAASSGTQLSSLNMRTRVRFRD